MSQHTYRLYISMRMQSMSELNHPQGLSDRSSSLESDGKGGERIDSGREIASGKKG